MTRHAAHVESIGAGRVGLYLGDGHDLESDVEGDDGYALVDEHGRIQWLVEDIDAGVFRDLPVDATTGSYILP
jgi:hypothetical protein